MKKFMSLLAVCVMVTGLTGCMKKSDKSQPKKEYKAKPVKKDSKKSKPAKKDSKMKSPAKKDKKSY